MVLMYHLTDKESYNTIWATQYEVVFQKHVCVSVANTTVDRFTLAEGL